MDKPNIAQRRPIVQPVEPGTYWRGACGRSAAQPLCDGAHKGTSFGPEKVEITEAGTIAWCACKHTCNKPFCDGSHTGLDAE